MHRFIIFGLKVHTVRCDVRIMSKFSHSCMISVISLALSFVLLNNVLANDYKIALPIANMQFSDANSNKSHLKESTEMTHSLLSPDSELSTFSTFFLNPSSVAAINLVGLDKNSNEISLTKVQIEKFEEVPARVCCTFNVTLKVIEVLHGNISIGDIMNTGFGNWKYPNKLWYPKTKQELKRDYIVATYISTTNSRELIRFSIEEAQYRKLSSGESE